MEYFNEIFMAFVMGGFLCLTAQALIDLTKLSPARIMVIYVTVGVILFASNIFTPLLNMFGSGVSVPLIGFGATIAKGVKEAVEKTGFLGIFEGGLSAGSIGITVALVLGLLLSFLFKGKPKKM